MTIVWWWSGIIGSGATGWAGKEKEDIQNITYFTDIIKLFKTPENINTFFK